MVKKLFAGALVLMLTTTLFTACNNQKSAKVRDSGEVTNTEKNNTTPTPPANSQSDNSGSQQLAKPYYGTWKIKNRLPTSNVQAISEQEAQRYIGKTITIKEDQIVTPDGTVKRPTFEEKTVTDADFYDGYRISFKEAGITGPKATEVWVTNYDINNGTEAKVGSNIIIAADSKALTFIGGALFELSK